MNQQEHPKRENFREAFIRLLKENGVDFDDFFFGVNNNSTRTGLFPRYVHFPPVTQAALGVIIIQLRSFYTSIFLFYEGQYL